MTRLFVLGNAGVDFGLPVPRMPRRGETLVAGRRTIAPGGKGLNQAVMAQRTGLVPVHFLAALGRDAEADLVETALQPEGFATLGLPRMDAPTDCSVLLSLPDGENCIVTAGACAAMMTMTLAAPVLDCMRRGDWLLLQGNLEFETTAAAVAAARATGAQVMLNPAPLQWDAAALLPSCAVVVANAGEAEAITGRTGEAAAAALHRAGPHLAVVTLGAAGCAVAQADGLRSLPATPAGVVDSTGAGDAFCGTLAACLAAGMPTASALARAQRAAAHTVAQPGAFAALPSAADLRRLA